MGCISVEMHMGCISIEMHIYLDIGCDGICERVVRERGLYLSKERMMKCIQEMVRERDVYLSKYRATKCVGTDFEKERERERERERDICVTWETDQKRQKTDQKSFVCVNTSLW